MVPVEAFRIYVGGLTEVVKLDDVCEQRAVCVSTLFTARGTAVQDTPTVFRGSWLFARNPRGLGFRLPSVTCGVVENMHSCCCRLVTRLGGGLIPRSFTVFRSEHRHSSASLLPME